MVRARAVQALGFDWVVCLSCPDVDVVIELMKWWDSISRVTSTRRLAEGEDMDKCEVCC
jgi:hypothetical protein